MLSAQQIVTLHNEKTQRWHLRAPDPAAIAAPASGSRSSIEDAWLAAVARHHFANFELWHIEDEARAPGATDAQLASVKRRIDATNQRRNDLAEALDQMLLDWLETRGLPHESAPLHSESPGLMIDRLSILALKIYHTQEEANRTDAPAGHAERNRERLTILQEQRADLARCLDALWRETLAGAKRFKIYRQLKMYNDPDLNPAIYSKGSR